jgi:uncharacterized membrane protein
MAFCAKCGTQVNAGASFCPACGAAVAVQGSAVSASGASAAPASAPVAVSSPGMTDNLAGALSYIWIVGLIFLFIEPFNRNKFVRFHAFQSVFYGVAWVVFWVAMHIVFGILSSITAGLVVFLALPLYGLIGLGGFVFWLFLAFKAYNNELYKAPFIGDLAAKQAGA